MRTTYLCVTWRASTSSRLKRCLEILRGGRVRLRAGADHLDRHGDAELVIEGLVDGAHAAGAEQLQDRVARADLLAGLERSIAGAHAAAAATGCRARSTDAGGPDGRAHRRRCRGASPSPVVAAGVGASAPVGNIVVRIGGSAARRTRRRRNRACRSSDRNPLRRHLAWPHFTHDRASWRSALSSAWAECACLIIAPYRPGRRRRNVVLVANDQQSAGDDRMAPGRQAALLRSVKRPCSR